MYFKKKFPGFFVKKFLKHCSDKDFPVNPLRMAKNLTVCHESSLLVSMRKTYNMPRYSINMNAIVVRGGGHE